MGLLRAVTSSGQRSSFWPPKHRKIDTWERAETTQDRATQDIIGKRKGPRPTSGSASRLISIQPKNDHLDQASPCPSV